MSNFLCRPRPPPPITTTIEFVRTLTRLIANAPSHVEHRSNSFVFASSPIHSLPRSRHFMEPDAIDALKMAVSLGTRSRYNTSSAMWKKQSSRPSTASYLRSGSYHETTNGRGVGQLRHGGHVPGVSHRDKQLIIPLKDCQYSVQSGYYDSPASEQQQQQNIPTELVSIAPIVPRSNDAENTSL